MISVLIAKLSGLFLAMGLPFMAKKVSSSLRRRNANHIGGFDGSYSTYMRHALALAQRGIGMTKPNPAVGAVLVRDGEIVGEGFTQPAGQAHAEIVAINQAGGMAHGATLYVTLEPCCHQGRTPPCIQAIFQAGIREVHIPITDPNPMVAGKGVKELRNHGISVVMGEEAHASQKLNESYFKFITTGIPFVTAKFASSLDGKIATSSGDSRWITGAAARGEAHKLRKASDALIVGVGTVLADDPQLTARNNEGQPLARQPVRVIVDSHGQIPASSRLFCEPGDIIIAGASIPTERKVALKQQAAEPVDIPADDGSVDLKELLALLGKRGVSSVLVEGGGALLGSFFDQGLVDKVVAFIAPIIIGGAMATPAIGGQGKDTVSEALHLIEIDTKYLDEDFMVVGYPVKGKK
ncbi:bifunctional diaminohydroxyphosphoribosylaminopyrimidine deaminase/5-amino-6-(5-phosphoribosylamino)uracil reductase RibD [Dehalococcoidia bacterium]|nr:bifunctional diaminohydroxyphosphoribosylaminopyrimidine deaminase/5-amino-6-(5-phosphoribosylamino)uracil reductase RibD [Dehalococcoidia bacterium]